MSNGAAVAAAVIAQAVKASGAIVRVAPNDFLTVLNKMEWPLVVAAEGKFLKTTYKYLTSYKGLVFFTKSHEPLPLPSRIELVPAKRIWIPN